MTDKAHGAFAPFTFVQRRHRACISKQGGSKHTDKRYRDSPPWDTDRGDAAGLAANLDFYQGLLGLTSDRGRPDFPGIPGFWMNVGETGQIHLFGGEQPSPLAKGADQDPESPHLALAVADILEANAELDRRGTPYWSLTGVAGPQALQLFVRDPYGNMIELHQVDQCRCRAVNRSSR